MLYIKGEYRDFPGVAVVKTLPSNTRGMDSILGQGAKIPHALWPKKQNIKQNQTILVDTKIQMKSKIL